MKLSWPAGANFVRYDNGQARICIKLRCWSRLLVQIQKISGATVWRTRALVRAAFLSSARTLGGLRCVAALPSTPVAIDCVAVRARSLCRAGEGVLAKARHDLFGHELH